MSRKKLVCLVLACVLLLCACGRNAEPTEDVPSATTSPKEDSAETETGETENDEAVVMDPYVELIMSGKTNDTYVNGDEFSYWIVTKRYSPDEGYVTITDYNGQDAQVVIPETLDGYPVVGLWNSAFEGCSFITDIQFPNTLRKLIFDNFSGGKVENFFTDTQWYQNLSDGLYYAGPVCLGYKGKMPADTTVILKEGTIAVGASAFQSSSDSITNIEFPESLRYLGGYCFAGAQIQEITVSSNWQHYGGAFTHCNSLRKVSFEEGVTKVSSSAFYQCKAIEEVVLPSTLQTIGSSAFYECTSLKSIEMPENLQEIRSLAFYGSGLASVDLNQGLGFIDDGAFAGCMNLESLYVPSSVQDFGEGPYGFDGPFNDLRPMEDGFVVYVEEGSSALEHAEYWGIKYEIYTPAAQ